VARGVWLSSLVIGRNKFEHFGAADDKSILRKHVR